VVVGVVLVVVVGVTVSTWPLRIGDTKLIFGLSVMRLFLTVGDGREGVSDCPNALIVTSGADDGLAGVVEMPWLVNVATSAASKLRLTELKLVFFCVWL
jgi:hypothetical protein